MTRVKVFTRDAMIFNDPKTGFYTLPAMTKGYLVKPTTQEKQQWIERYQTRLQEKCLIVLINGIERLVEARKLITMEEIERRRQELIRAGLVLEEN